MKINDVKVGETYAVGYSSRSTSAVPRSFTVTEIRTVTERTVGYSRYGGARNVRRVIGYWGEDKTAEVIIKADRILHTWAEEQAYRKAQAEAAQKWAVKEAVTKAARDPKIARISAALAAVGAKPATNTHAHYYLNPETGETSPRTVEGWEVVSLWIPEQVDREKALTYGKIEVSLDDLIALLDATVKDSALSA